MPRDSRSRGRRDSRNRRGGNISNINRGRGGKGGANNPNNIGVGSGQGTVFNAFSDNSIGNPQNNVGNIGQNVQNPSQNNINNQQRQPMGGPRRDERPDVERRKGGVKLFVGRIPQECSEQLLRKTFERFGQVLEVFKMRGERPGEERHSLYHEDGLTCAFV